MMHDRGCFPGSHLTGNGSTGLGQECRNEPFISSALGSTAPSMVCIKTKHQSLHSLMATPYGVVKHHDGRSKPPYMLKRRLVVVHSI